MRRTIRSAAALTLLSLLMAAPAAATSFTATLSGAAERPNPTPSTATGVGSIVLNDPNTLATVSLSWSGLMSPPLAAHVHGPAGPNGTAPPVPGFDLSSLVAGQGTTGSLQTVLPITPSQVADLIAGLWYFNIHTEHFIGGEIRGQLVEVPEPGTLLLSSAGLLGLFAAGRRRAR